MRAICESVQKNAGAAIDRACYFLTRKHSAERRVSTRNTFADKNQIRFHTPVIDCKRSPRAAHSRHDFVGDQKNAVFAANFCDALQISLGRRHRAKRRAADRLKNERRNTLRASIEIAPAQHPIQFIRTMHSG